MTEKKVEIKKEDVEKPKKWLSGGAWIWGALTYILWMQVVWLTPPPPYILTLLPNFPGWVLWGVLAIIATTHFYFKYAADFLCQKLSNNR